MNLTELKRKSAAELVAIAEEMGLDGIGRSKKQDVIFSVLKAHAKKGEKVACRSSMIMLSIAAV